MLDLLRLRFSAITREACRIIISDSAIAVKEGYSGTRGVGKVEGDNFGVDDGVLVEDLVGVVVGLLVGWKLGVAVAVGDGGDGSVTL